MVCSIVACGSSARDWHKTPYDLSVGVNDMLKFGHQPDQLVLINFKGKFTPDRLKLILATRPKKLWTHTNTWRHHFSNVELIRFSHFSGYFMKGNIYNSKTSPIVAICIAIKQGATEIILWGVDMINHKTYAKGTRQGDFEAKTYLKFFEAVEKKGIKIYRGADGSVFDTNLPLHEVCGTHT
jgi:hypothetical protein